jgi:hypothetical protein
LVSSLAGGTVLVDLEDGRADLVDGGVEFVEQLLMRRRTSSSTIAGREICSGARRRRGVG